MHKVLTAMALLPLPLAAQAEDVAGQEFTAQEIGQVIDRACLTENPKMFLRNARYLRDIGWDGLGETEDAAGYASPGGGVTIKVEEGTIDATCTVEITQGAVEEGWDPIPLIQTEIDDFTGGDIEPTYDGEAFVWAWDGDGAYMMQTYSARVTSNAGTTIVWATE